MSKTDNLPAESFLNDFSKSLSKTPDFLDPKENLEVFKKSHKKSRRSKISTLSEFVGTL